MKRWCRARSGPKSQYPAEPASKSCASWEGVSVCSTVLDGRASTTSAVFENRIPCHCSQGRDSLQKPVEDVCVEEVEGSDHNVGAKKSSITTHTDTSHPCASCSFDPCRRVFHHNASVSSYPKPESRREKHFGIGFSLGDILSR